MRKIITLLAALASTSALAIATALPASATGPGPWWIGEANGGYWVGSADVSAGTQVWEVAGSVARSMTWVSNGNYYNGDPTGYFNFYNGNLMAARNDCAGVTIKSSPSSDGVIWALNYTGGNLYIVNRYCDQYNGDSSEVLAGHDRLHWQYIISGPHSGIYRAMVLIPAS